MHIPGVRKVGALHIGIQKDRVIHILFVEKKGGQSYIWQRWKRGPFGTHIRSMPDIGSYPRPPPRGSSRMVDVLKGPSSWSVISKTASDWIIVEQWKVYRNMRYFSIIVSSSVPSEWLIKTLNEHNLCTTIWAIISRMTIYHKYTYLYSTIKTVSTTDNTKDFRFHANNNIFSMCNSYKMIKNINEVNTQERSQSQRTAFTGHQRKITLGTNNGKTKRRICIKPAYGKNK